MRAHLKQVSYDWIEVAVNFYTTGYILWSYQDLQQNHWN